MKKLYLKRIKNSVITLFETTCHPKITIMLKFLVYLLLGEQLINLLANRIKVLSENNTYFFAGFLFNLLTQSNMNL